MKRKNNPYRGAWYWNGFFVVALMGFIAIWIYSMFAWGLLIGLLVGWLPALIGGAVLGLLWPVSVSIFILIVVSNWDTTQTIVQSILIG